MDNDAVTSHEEMVGADATDDARIPYGLAGTLLVAGLGGMAASFILVLEKIRLLADPSYVTSCDVNPWISCGQVMQRWQSEVFGFPNPLIGVAGFAVVIAVGLMLFAGASPARWFWLLVQAGITAGSAFALWLWSQALFDIHILCLYCMVVWAAMIPIAITVTVRNAELGVVPLPGRTTAFLTAWQGTMIALAYIVAAGSVVITFLPSLL